MNGALCQLYELVVQGLVQPVVLRFPAVGGHPVRHLRAVQKVRKVQPLGLPVVYSPTGVQLVHTAYHLVDGAEPKLGHNLTHVLRYEKEVVDDILRPTGEELAQLRVLGGDAHRAGVQVTLAEHDDPKGDQGSGGAP